MYIYLRICVYSVLYVYTHVHVGYFMYVRMYVRTFSIFMCINTVHLQSIEDSILILPVSMFTMLTHIP